MYYWPTFLVLTLFGLAVLPFILLFNVLFLGRGVPSALRRAIRFYGWVLVCFVPFLAPVKVVYPGGKLPGPAIYVANHNSAIDPFLFGAIAIENSFVTSWPFKIPVYGFFMRLAGYANAEAGWEEICAKGRELLAAGSSLTIWPEGHRSRDGSLGRFKKGAFSLAVETGMPIVPVCILGSGQVMRPGSRFLRPGRIKLIVLEPVYPAENEDSQQEAGQLRRKVRKRIEATLRENGHFPKYSAV